MFDFSRVIPTPYPLTFPRVDKETQEYRMSVCNSCDDLVLKKFCKHCGCYMPFKTELRNSSCPIDKWPQIYSTNNI